MRTRFDFDQLALLLGRSEEDPLVRGFFGQELSNIARDEYYGSLEFKLEGVDVVFKEAAWIVPSENIDDSKVLCVAGFHLHCDGHEGFAAYPGELPNGIAFGNSETELLQRMGEPMRKGGGVTSSVTKQLIPTWFWFSMGTAILHIQLDSTGRIDMATLQTPDIELD